MVPSAESCDSGADEDCDGLLDCADDDCETDPACCTPFDELVPIVPPDADVLFVVDRSGSMDWLAQGTTNTRWLELRNAMATLDEEQVALLREKLSIKRANVVTEARVERKGGSAVIRRRKRTETEPEAPAAAQAVELVSSEPALESELKQWTQSRSEFNTNLNKPDSQAAQDRWQKSYFKGVQPSGESAPQSHQSRLRLNPFDADDAAT